MSADNGIYVVGFLKLTGEREYRVAICSAIDNLYPINEDDIELTNWGKWVESVFKSNGENVFDNKKDALQAANLIGANYGTEYGIVSIDVDFQFPERVGEIS